MRELGSLPGREERQPLTSGSWPGTHPEAVVFCYTPTPTQNTNPRQGHPVACWRGPHSTTA